MNPTPLSHALGPAGWIVLLAFCSNALVRLIKSDKLEDWLSSVFGRPMAVPKPILPWLAFLFTFAGGTLDAKTGGAAWGDAFLSGCWALLGGGTLAVAAHEALERPVRALLGHKIGNALFGQSTDAAPLPGAVEAVPARVDPPKGGGGGAGLLGAAALALLVVVAIPSMLAGCTAIPPIVTIANVVAVAAPYAAQVVDDVQAFLTSYFAAHPNQQIQAAIAMKLEAAKLAALGLGKLGTTGQEVSEKDYLDALATFAQAYNDLYTAVQELEGVQIVAPSAGAPKVSGKLGVMVLRAPPPAAFAPRAKGSK